MERGIGISHLTYRSISQHNEIARLYIDGFLTDVRHNSDFRELNLGIGDGDLESILLITLQVLDEWARSRRELSISGDGPTV